MSPYVIIIAGTLLLNVERTKANVAISEPATQTARQPNLLQRADTIGPVKKILINTTRGMDGM